MPNENEKPEIDPWIILAPLDGSMNVRVSRIIGQLIQNRSNGCLNADWSRQVGKEIVEEIERQFYLVRKEA